MTKPTSSSQFIESNKFVAAASKHSTNSSRSQLNVCLLLKAHFKLAITRKRRREAKEK